MKKINAKLDGIKDKARDELLEKDKRKEKEKEADARSSVSSGFSARVEKGNSKHERASIEMKVLQGAPELFQPQTSSAPDASTSRPPSVASQKSAESEESEESVAVRMDPPAPAELDLSDDDGDDEAEQDEHAFDHPSTYVEQPWIWIPKDTLGLCEVLVQELKDAGVESSSLGATMDEHGIVEVSRNPPEEEWLGGHDL